MSDCLCNNDNNSPTNIKIYMHMAYNLCEINVYISCFFDSVEKSGNNLPPSSCVYPCFSILSTCTVIFLYWIKHNSKL